MTKKRKTRIFTSAGKKYFVIDILLLFALFCFAIDFIVKYYFLKHTLWNWFIFVGICIDTIGKLALAIVPIIRVIIKNGRRK